MPSRGLSKMRRAAFAEWSRIVTSGQPGAAVPKVCEWPLVSTMINRPWRIRPSSNFAIRVNALPFR
jgi:hypothetical protein